MSKSQKVRFLVKMTVKKRLQKGYKPVTFSSGDLKCHFLHKTCAILQNHIKWRVGQPVYFYFTPKVGDIFIFSNKKHNIRKNLKSQIAIATCNSSPKSNDL